jgi:hypothetical protein
MRRQEIEAQLMLLGICQQPPQSGHSDYERNPPDGCEGAREFSSV